MKMQTPRPVRAPQQRAKTQPEPADKTGRPHDLQAPDILGGIEPLPLPPRRSIVGRLA
jgi:hypothetical protein